MRHAIITVHLIREARAAADAEADERRARTPLAEHLAEPDTDTQERRARRLATLARRARALVARTT
jgi:hypothetical protein